MPVILDASSPRVIGPHLDDTLAVLKMALAERGAPAGLVNYSNRGVQYAGGH